MILTIKVNNSGLYWFNGFSDGLVDSKVGISKEADRIYFSANNKADCIQLAIEYKDRKRACIAKCTFERAISDAESFVLNW